MEETFPQISMSWDAQKNICNGLSSLQQNGQFVDMTIAADGHFVKVHQVVIALASPYLKELISSTSISHPIIFLNKVSYEVLSLLLEYIYTGETVVSYENLNTFIQAARELRIKGIQDVTVKEAEQMHKNNDVDNSMEDVQNEDYRIIQVGPESMYEDSKGYSGIKEIEVTTEDDTRQDTEDETDEIAPKESQTQVAQHMQYTVSNQGSLQMILNRYMYYLKYSSKHNSRQWRCVDYVNDLKCPAYVMAQGDAIIKRVQAHKHGFHDERILKRLRAGKIFTQIKEAESTGKLKRNKKQKGAEDESDSVGSKKQKSNADSNADNSVLGL